MTQETFTVHMKEYQQEPDNIMEIEHIFDDANIETTETVSTTIIEGITWISAPEYDAEINGCYIFTPVLPEKFILGENVELPEIIVIVCEEAELELMESSETVMDTRATLPSCGEISSDTTWTSGTLANGTLKVQEGATLTITGVIKIVGNVTIEGGGTILRGNANAYFDVRNAELTLGNITIEGNQLASDHSMIEAMNSGYTISEESTIILNDGCKIRNMVLNESSSPRGGGAAMVLYCCTLVLNDAVIENCVSPGFGGAIFVRYSRTTINDGIYRYNHATSVGITSGIVSCGGGFFYNAQSELYIYGGNFIENSAVNEGGCIFTVGTKTVLDEIHLFGGYFQGNESTYSPFHGGGAIFVNAQSGYIPECQSNDSIFNLSSNAQFCGNGVNGSGIDGIYLDINVSEDIFRKVQIISQMSYPIDIYLDASEGCVIAQGTAGYILQDRDVKMINFHDVGDSGKEWYAVLDKSENQIYISEVRPQYMDKFFVYYISNGATGTVTDDNNNDEGYGEGDTVTVQSAEGLSWENHKFIEWNTKADGSGESYQPGDELTITSDIELHAIFEEVVTKPLTVTFYSGDPIQMDTMTVYIEEDAVSGTLKAPELKDINGWTTAGWAENENQYEAKYKVGDLITITEATSFYGVYQKDVTLTYDANGGNSAPEPVAGSAYVNVHEDISYKHAEFHVASGIDREEYEFAGWNTKPDGMGESYQPEDELKITDDIYLYAIFAEITAGYTVEHYLQNLNGEGYTKAESDTQELSDTIGKTVTAEAKSYEGFTENTTHSSRVSSGAVAADGSLALQLYYDRNTYNVSFDLNYESSDNTTTPSMQTILYGNKLNEVIPTRRGYSFKGWYMDPKATGNSWDFDNTVESITEENTTLYAKWVDDIAPVLGETSYNNGYSNLGKWIARKKDLVITVPISEEGSGVDETKYVLTLTNGETVSGEIRVSDINTPGKIRSDSVMQFDAGDDGQSIVTITISEKYEGTVYLKCTDNAGNLSEKMLTVEGGGIIEEDNAPEMQKNGEEQKSENEDESQKETTTSDTQNGSTAYTDETDEEFTTFVQLVQPTQQDLPKDSEPDTGDTSIQVEVYATMAMVAGMFYILLYLSTGENGMTEEEKNNFVSKIIAWAKRGSRLRNPIAMAAIFWVLFYYHSIGKRVEVEWNEVYGDFKYK